MLHNDFKCYVARFTTHAQTWFNLTWPNFWLDKISGESHHTRRLLKCATSTSLLNSFCSNVLKHVLGRTWELPLRRTLHECCRSLFFIKCTIRNITFASVSNFICIETWTDAVIVASKRQLHWWIKWMKQNGKNEQSNILQISPLKGAVSRNPSELATTLTDNKCLKK